MKKIDVDEIAVRGAIQKIAGEEGLEILELLKNKDNISEFELSEKLRLTINQVRNILYRFDKYGLVSSTRKKDRKKGWYIYYWTFNWYKAEDLVISLKKEKLKRYKSLLKQEKSTPFYVCPKKHIRLSFEKAAESQFQCLSLKIPKNLFLV